MVLDLAVGHRRAGQERAEAVNVNVVHAPSYANRNDSLDGQAAKILRHLNRR
jgi:hypothetical protein